MNDQPIDPAELDARNKAWHEYYCSCNYAPVVMPAFDYAWNAALKWKARQERAAEPAVRPSVSFQSYMWTATGLRAVERNYAGVAQYYNANDVDRATTPRPQSALAAQPAVPAGWQQYLKEGESPLERMERERKDTAALLGMLAERTRLIERLLAEPYGCTLCDSGKPRDAAKGHQPDCPFEMARIALSAAPKGP